MRDTLMKRVDHEKLFTHTECEEILKNFLSSNKPGSNGKVLNFSIVPESGPIGYLGEYFHLQLSYQIDDGSSTTHKLRLFVKAMPYTNADLSYFIEKSGILHKEATLYKTLLNELRKFSKSIWCAQCYLTRKDLFVMENIVDLGYESLKDPAAFLSAAQVKPLLRSLATLHACSIAYEVNNNVLIGEQLKDVLYEVTVSPTVDWFTAGARAVLAVATQHPNYQSDAVKEFIKTQLPARLDTVYEMVNPSKKYRNVFCHRDPWGGNVFYNKAHPNDVAAIFVDFQLCRYSPPAIDVLMAVYLNMSPKERKLHMAEFCQYYYQCFSEELKAMGLNAEEHITFAEFQNSMKDLQLYGAFYNCLSATILRVPGDYLKAMKENNPEDFHRYANVDRTKDVLKLVQTHADFRDYMHDCFEDVMELVLPDSLK